MKLKQHLWQLLHWDDDSIDEYYFNGGKYDEP